MAQKSPMVFFLLSCFDPATKVKQGINLKLVKVQKKKKKKKKSAKGATIKHDGEMYISSSAPLFLFVTWSAKKYLKQVLLGIRVV